MGLPEDQQNAGQGRGGDEMSDAETIQEISELHDQVIRASLELDDFLDACDEHGSARPNDVQEAMKTAESLRVAAVRLTTLLERLERKGDEKEVIE